MGRYENYKKVVLYYDVTVMIRRGTRSSLFLRLRPLRVELLLLVVEAEELLGNLLKVLLLVETLDLPVPYLLHVPHKDEVLRNVSLDLQPTVHPNQIPILVVLGAELRMPVLNMFGPQHLGDHVTCGSLPTLILELIAVPGGC